MIKVLSLFSGIGAFERALENLKVPYELVGYCEIDKFASKSFALLHGVSEDLNLRDVTQVDTSRLPGGIDLVTYGFPCQDISLAGRQKGLEHNGEKTRSGLVWDAHRIIGEVKPKVAICENVKNLTGKKFIKEFKAILENLEELGYNNYYKVLNAKDYGVPQNRERVFIVSVRKDIDKGSFDFPEKQELKLCLADILDKEVDEKYYLSDKLLNFFIQNNRNNEAKGNGFRFQPSDGSGVAKTITTRVGACRADDNYIKVDSILQVGNLKTDSKRKDPQVGRVYSPCGICPTLNTMQGGQREPKVLIKSNTTKGYTEATAGDSLNIAQPSSKTRRGRVGKGVANTLTTQDTMCVIEPNVLCVGGIGETKYGKQHRQGDRVYSDKGLAACLTASPLGNHGGYSSLYTDGYRIRKLTPRECFALMGFQKEDADKLSDNGISNTQLYKQAGNSIVVDVLMGIFGNLKGTLYNV